MVLVSIAAGEPSHVRVYSCARGSLLRVKMVDVRFNMTPDKFEVQDLQRRPLAFVANATEPEVA